MKLKTLLLMSLVSVAACQNAAKNNNANANNEVEDLLKDIVTHDVDLGSVSLLYMNNEIFDGIKSEPYDTYYRATYIRPTNYYANSKFADYCNKKGGNIVPRQFADSIFACENKINPSTVAFAYRIAKEPSWKYKRERMFVEFFEPKDNNVEFVKYLQRKGYLSVADRKQKTITDEKTKLEQAKLEAEKRQKENIDYMNKTKELKKLSIKTRNSVIAKGTQICSTTPYQVTTAFTEDYANGKIKILTNNSYSWDWPEHWYACDSK